MPRQHDDNMQGENYWFNGERLRELGIHLTIGANGQIIGIKYSSKRGVSESLYKWTGAQPQAPIRNKKLDH